MNTRAEYIEGKTLGYAFADEDRRDGGSLATWEADLRAQAREAREGSKSFYALRLGIVRGYREAVRTLNQEGRWGT